MNVSCAVLSGETFCWTDEIPENPNTLRESMLKLLMYIVGISTMYYFPATFLQRKRSTSRQSTRLHPIKVRCVAEVSEIRKTCGVTYLADPTPRGRQQAG